MKKTEKTALTAAVFAAALNLIPSGTANPQTVKAADSIPVEYPVYGTIPAWETTPATVTKPAETIAYPVYGTIPAWETTAPTPTRPAETDVYPVYGTIPAWKTTVAAPKTTTTAPSAPLPLYADINDDGRIDAYDYLLIRKNISGQPNGFDCDLNGDGVTDIADLVRFQRYLLGGDEPYVTTTEPEMAPVYGPPVAFERNTVTTAAYDVPEE
ncbi:MAG: hypothetical protein J6K77_03225 [Ruminococcus sp.]|nr:hypothetical protein [Ruminococcus sp.]